MRSALAMFCPQTAPFRERPTVVFVGKCMTMKRTRLASFFLLAMLSTGWALCDSDRRTAERVAELLEFRDGFVVADVGAGDGRWTVELAQLVGESGRVIATEVDEDEMKKLKRKARGHRNITFVMADQEQAGLEDRCCDAIHLRHVYHHFKKPKAMQAELLRVLKPGRLIAVIDFEPDDNHGVRAEKVRKEMTATGFEFVLRIDEWEGRSSRYLLLFRRPL